MTKRQTERARLEEIMGTSIKLRDVAFAAGALCCLMWLSGESKPPSEMMGARPTAHPTRGSRPASARTAKARAVTPPPDPTAGTLSGRGSFLRERWAAHGLAR